MAAASPSLRIADPNYNAETIIGCMKRQAECGTEILVFPELSLSGYTAGDLLISAQLLKGCVHALDRIAEATKNLCMLVFVGLPLASQQGKVFNCAAAVSGGEIKGIVAKKNLPNYGEFYEKRHFAVPRENDCVILNGKLFPLYGNLLFADEEHREIAVGCEICEDLWVSDPPSNTLAAAGATIVVNLSASNETVGKREYRHKIVSAQSGKNLCAYVYCDASTDESTSDMVFAGNHMIYENGALLSEAKPFSMEVCEAEIDVGFLLSERRKINTFAQNSVSAERVFCRFVGEGELSLREVQPLPFVPREESALNERAQLILNIQAQGLARRLRQVNAKTAVIGISGGLDSALALLVTVHAFDLLSKPHENILAYTMPGFGTTGKTKNNSVLLMQEVGATARTVPISDTVLSHFQDIGHDKENYNATYENAQARYRTMILMDVANETGGLVIGTGDLSELALGWCTYNGDHMSMYAVNCSVPKTLVKHLVRAEGRRLGGKTQEILESILSTAISPELLPPDSAGNIAQKTEDLIGPYELHDFYLYRFMRRGDSPAKTLYLAEYAFKNKYDRATLKKWLVNFYRRFFSQQFKRNCVPDGVKVGSVSLSPRADWRMPSDASALLWLSEAESL